MGLKELNGLIFHNIVIIKIFYMLSNVIKNVMRIWYYEILNSSGKTCGLQLTSLMFKFSWEMLFVENGDTEAFKADRNKLFVSDEKQIDNYTIRLDMLHL